MLPTFKFITFTGIDDKTSLQSLAEFNNVEWGVLLSRSNEGIATRYPSRQTIQKIGELPIKKAGHICGAWIRELLAGDFSLIRERPEYLQIFPRFQLNFHGKKRIPSPNFYEILAAIDKEFIFQLDGVNDFIYHEALDFGINAVPLFDMSHGEGQLPKQWQSPVAPFCGYAGGLTPQNIKTEFNKIKAIAGDFWLDMETGVRSTNDFFDLTKVKTVLEELYGNNL